MEKEIKAFLAEQFLTDVGFSKCEDTPFPGLTHAVSMVFGLSDAVVEGITDMPTHTYFHHYRTMNAYIDSVSLRLVLYLQSRDTARRRCRRASRWILSAVFSPIKKRPRAQVSGISAKAHSLFPRRGVRVCASAPCLQMRRFLKTNFRKNRSAATVMPVHAPAAPWRFAA